MSCIIECIMKEDSDRLYELISKCHEYLATLKDVDIDNYLKKNDVYDLEKNYMTVLFFIFINGNDKARNEYMCEVDIKKDKICIRHIEESIKYYISNSITDDDLLEKLNEHIDAYHHNSIDKVT
jgi:hypothetical protein